MEIINTMYEAHIYINDCIKNGDFEGIIDILQDCQQAALEIGTTIEETEGEGTFAVACLEEYSEMLYDIATDRCGNMEIYVQQINAKLNEAEQSIINDINAKLEVLFLPYKSSMWDSMESIWKATLEDAECDVYVVPIPYYDRNPDRTFGEYHYEGYEYPEYVSVTHYEEYNIAERRPDIIYIHNPYDNCNLVTSVDPRFYSRELKQYTECLVYVPYYLFPNKLDEYPMVLTPVLYSADIIVAQNEFVRDAYIQEIKNLQASGININCQVIAMGTPKTDKMVRVLKEGVNIPDEWISQSTNKRKIFLNTNVSLILNNGDKFVENMRRVFELFNKRQDVFVVWREHPLTYETLKSMKNNMICEYEELKSFFVDSGIGVIDDHVEAYEAMSFSDCYFGAGGSLIPIYAVSGKPMLITAYKYPDNIINRTVSVEILLKQAERNMYFSERYENFISLFLDNYEKIMEYRDRRYELLNEITIISDGNVGRNIMKYVKSRGKDEYEQ